MDYIKLNELYHWGVKGMKWGVRNYRNEDGTLTPAGQARYNEDGTRKKAKDMSDDDLQRSNRRLQAEKQYEQLSETNAHKNLMSAKRIGISTVGSFLIGAGSSIAYNAINKGSIKVGKEAIGKSMIIGGLAAASALATGIVTSQGGQVTTMDENKVFKKQKQQKQSKQQTQSSKKNK